MRSDVRNIAIIAHVDHGKTTLVHIETMRREGYELMVSQPQVIFRLGEDGEMLEPYEDVVIDLDEAVSGAVIEEQRR